MGQKINPNSLRLGVTKHWKTEFFEKKPKELPKYTFKDLELKSYTERFLNNYGIFLHDYRQKFSNSSLIFYLSYFVTPFFVKKASKTKKITKIIAVNRNGEEKTLIKILKPIRKKHFRRKKRKNINSSFASWQSEIPSIKVYKYLMFKYNRKFKTIKFSKFKSTNLKGIFLKFLKTINLFTNNKYNLIFNVSCSNKKLKISTTRKSRKQLLLKLKRFKNLDFFKNGIELLLNSITNKNSANLLVKFIAAQIKKDKKHKFFLSFLKKILTPILKSDISILRGIKIKVKGRLNGVPKAKQKILIIGNVPAQSINIFIDYAHCAVHNKNGTYGVKIWTALK